MKKIKVVGMVIFSALVLASCGSSPEKEVADTLENTSESTVQEEKEEAKEMFKDGVLSTDKFKIVITDRKVIPVGEPGNEYGDKPVLAFWYDTTNLTDEELDPSSAWIFHFSAIQDNDPNSINELNIASLPDAQFLDSQTEKIKKDGTVSNAVAYELDDETTPVTLIYKDFIGEEKGSIEYPLN